MAKILITGANGFIGSHLTDLCIDRGHQVFALTKPDTSLINLNRYRKAIEAVSINERLEFSGEKIQVPTDNENIKIFECNVKDSKLLKEIIKTTKPDLIFHFAAQPLVIPSWRDPAETIRTNVIGTINLFEALKVENIKARVIVACSSAEYGTTTELNRPLKEEDPLMAIHPYGISKIATELLSRQYFINFGIDAINLRYFLQTGPRKVNDACSDFTRKVAQIDLDLSEPNIKVGNLETFRDIMGIKDTIKATWLAATNGESGETYNVCSSRKLKIRDLLNIILSFSKNEIKVYEKTQEKLRKTDEDAIVGDNSKIKTELGFKVEQSIEETLEEMYEYWIKRYKKEKEKS